jgi:hypothetical protein
MIARADATEDPKIAARFRERAQDYLLLAQALDDAAPEPQGALNRNSTAAISPRMLVHGAAGWRGCIVSALGDI